MTAQTYLSQFVRMYELRVYDQNGNMWLPLFGYDGAAEAYAPAEEAWEVFDQVWSQ